MRKSTHLKTIAAALASTCLYACDGSKSETSKNETTGGPTILASACELVDDGDSFDRRLVRFRSEFELGMEFIRVVDSRCPQARLFLRHKDAKIDFSLCSEEGMRFGCPVDPRLHVKATFTGVFHHTRSSGGHVDVISMTEISSDSGPK